MSEIEEFFTKPITNLERARKAFIYCGCNTYHMWHDYTERYKEYKNLKIPRSLELKWVSEQFDLELHSFNIASEYGWSQYGQLVQKAKTLNRLSVYNKLLNLTKDMVDDIPKNKIPLILNEIVGNNASEAHGGLIESLIEIKAKGIVEEFSNISKKLIVIAINCNIDVDYQEKNLEEAKLYSKPKLLSKIKSYIREFF